MKAPKSLTYLTYAAIIGFLVTLYMMFFYAPREVLMGEVQRIFYQHVAFGWWFSVAFAVTLLAGIMYLITRDLKWDRWAVAGAEVGIIFTLLNIASGSIWGKPAWNTWWTWDPRLTTATITLLLYIAYLMLRQSIESPTTRARFAAVYGIVSFISVPLTIFAIRIWRTIHPVVIGSGDPTAEGSFNMTQPMLITMLAHMALFGLIFAALLWHRYQLETEAAEVADLKTQLLLQS